MPLNIHALRATFSAAGMPASRSNPLHSAALRADQKSTHTIHLKTGADDRD
jgi:hypothetical protein